MTVTPRGWQTLVENVRHPSRGVLGDLCYHVEDGRYQMLVYNARIDNYEAVPVSDADVMTLGLTGVEAWTKRDSASTEIDHGAAGYSVPAAEGSHVGGSTNEDHAARAAFGCAPNTRMACCAGPSG